MSNTSRAASPTEPSRAESDLAPTKNSSQGHNKSQRSLGKRPATDAHTSPASKGAQATTRESKRSTKSSGTSPKAAKSVRKRPSKSDKVTLKAPTQSGEGAGGSSTQGSAGPVRRQNSAYEERARRIDERYTKLEDLMTKPEAEKAAGETENVTTRTSKPEDVDFGKWVHG